jgi:hypothetical protein
MESFNKYKKSSQKESTSYSLQSIKFMDPEIKSLDCETDGLLDFEVQITLDSFQKTKEC